MKHARIDIGSIRRQQVVDAAITIIVEEGIQNLSLSAIEQRVGMSRGQLTYYFKTKEEIFLAIFDRLLEMMCQRFEHAEFEDIKHRQGWVELLRRVLTLILKSPPVAPGFQALEYTFLSQMSHRDDFRVRLAELYEDWRTRIAADVAEENARRGQDGKADPRVVATVLQAMIHGMVVQRAVDPKAMDVDAVIHLVVDMVETAIWGGNEVKCRAPRKRITSGGSES